MKEATPSEGTILSSEHELETRDGLIEVEAKEISFFNGDQTGENSPISQANKREADEYTLDDAKSYED